MALLYEMDSPKGSKMKAPRGFQISFVENGDVPDIMKFSARRELFGREN
jgi:hypothetical protein